MIKSALVFQGFEVRNIVYAELLNRDDTYVMWLMNETFDILSM